MQNNTLFIVKMHNTSIHIFGNIQLKNVHINAPEN